MIILGNVVIGASNNWRKMHGIPKFSTKRYSHERRDVPKYKRVKYHTMKKAGCDDLLISRYIGDYYILRR